MTHDDCKKLEKLTKNINKLIESQCREYNDYRRSIDYVDLCALIVISGVLKNKFPGLHDNVATVSNILCISYDRAMEVCDNLFMLRHLEEFNNGCNIKLTCSGLEFIKRYIDDNLFTMFMVRMFKEINSTLYPEGSCSGCPEDTDLKIGVYNCSSILYEKILELPCVYLCYQSVIDSFHGLSGEYARGSFDLTMNHIKAPPAFSEYRDRIEATIISLINQDVVSPDDIGYLKNSLDSHYMKFSINGLSLNLDYDNESKRFILK